MRFDRIRVSHFGGLHHVDTGEDTLGPLVVVYGPNESGKSTFFHFLTSMLYGFRPARPGQHPYSPWSGDEIQGDAAGRFDGGGSWEVSRRLRSSPWGRLKTEAGETELRNHALPFVEHVPRSVFQKVFALTLSELATLDGETWETLQDRLLARMVRSDLRAARDVAAELRTERNALWRADRRGRPRARAITEELLRLQRDRREAVGRDRELRHRSEELKDARRELEGIRERRAALQATVDRLERALPSHALLTRLQRLEDSVDPSHLEGLPADPVAALERARTESRARRSDAQRLEGELAEAEGRLPTLDATDAALLDRRTMIDTRREAYEEMQDLRARVSAAQEDLDELDHRATALLHEVCGAGAPDVLAAMRADLPLDTIAEEAGRLRVRQEERRAREQAAAAIGSPRSAGGGGPVGLVCLIGGITLVGVGALMGAVAATAIGVGLMAVAALLLVLEWDRSRRSGATGSEAELARARRAEAASSDRLVTLLDGFPLRPELLANPTPDTVTRLETLATVLRERGQRESSAAPRVDRLRKLDDDVRALLEDVGAPPQESSVPERTLFRLLADAVERDRDVQRIGSEIERIESRLVVAREELEEAESLERSLRERLASLTDGDADSGAEIAREQLRSAARLAEARSELTERYGPRDEVEAALSSVKEELGEPLDDGLLDRVRRELSNAQERELRISETASALERDVVHLETARTAAAIDGEIEALKAERAEVIRRRDQLLLLERVVEEADRRFRDRHQPDVVKRSGRYLARITDGRYRRMLAGEDQDTSALVLQMDGGRAVDLDGPLSTGTKEQVLLSLRLAVADHLDSTGERMPLFIDEAFVNWDRGRRTQGIDLVSELSETRQIFVFTCHEDLAGALSDGGAHIVHLERLPG